MIAGLSGDSGKTIASLSLLTALRQAGLAVSVFKKGPDYIDAAWLGWAAGNVCRNLDMFMVDEETVADRFARHAATSDLAVIEGNRGLFDGKDVAGSYSSAALAKALDVPVVLVVNATKTTRTLAALVKGCVDFDPDLKIAGVVLNRVAGKRHERVVSDAIAEYCQIPVLGVIPKLDETGLIPGRHLGLVTPSEFDDEGGLGARLAEIGNKHLDLDGLKGIADAASETSATIGEVTTGAPKTARIAYFRDSVFTFYYPENLEALEDSGAELVPLSSLDDAALPADIDGLYIGGGFPETQADRLSSNRSMMVSVKAAAECGLPIYAECGGLIYLSRSVTAGGAEYAMAGVFPLRLAMNKRPVGHGYVESVVDCPNPFLAEGTVVRGHEFHYSGPVEQVATASCMKMRTGVGIGGGRDGLLARSALAMYTHLHADGVKTWAPGMVAAAARYRMSRCEDRESDADGCDCATRKRIVANG